MLALCQLRRQCLKTKTTACGIELGEGRGAGAREQGEPDKVSLNDFLTKDGPVLLSENIRTMRFST